MTTLDTVLYTGRTRVTGGREGRGRSDDGAIDVALSTPGAGRPGTNPEQLLGIGWSACFIGALRAAALAQKVALPAGTAVDAEIDLGKTGGGAHYQLAARLTVHLPGLDPATQEQLVERAHQTCPYSRATRGNIDVAFVLR